MIIMDIKINNFYAFKDFHMNMSYPKKIVNSLIPNEFLAGFPNFRYKKVNILMGGNATGKTTLGEAILDLLDFLIDPSIDHLAGDIGDRKQEASFTMDFVITPFINTPQMYRVAVTIPAKFKSRNDNYTLTVTHVDIRKNDSYEKCAGRLAIESCSDREDSIKELKRIRHDLSWFFSSPSDESNLEQITDDSGKYLQLLKIVLMTLDPSILDIIPVSDVADSYIIKTKHRDIIIQDGKIANPALLSSGTLKGIDIAAILYHVRNTPFSFYYCDEKFIYVHSDIEKAFLSAIISSLKDNNQIFFTTHNSDILDLALPKHTYTFLKKELVDGEHIISCVNAANYLKRNTDSLRSAVENDLFSTAPESNLLDQLDHM